MMHAAIPICETYRSVGIHAFQGPRRIAVVKRAIDEVLAMNDIQKLVGYAYDWANPPEARLLARSSLEKAFVLAAELRQTRPEIDFAKLQAGAPSLLDKVGWIDRQAYGTVVEPEAPGSRRKVPREDPLPEILAG